MSGVDMGDGPGRSFYERQIALLEAGDVDGLIERQYHDDATLIGFDFVVSGRDALHSHFESYLASLGRLNLKSTDKFVETPDSIFFEATILTDRAEAHVYDVFMLREGRATHHFTGVTSVVALPAQEA